MPLYKIIFNQYFIYLSHSYVPSSEVPRTALVISPEAPGKITRSAFLNDGFREDFPAALSLACTGAREPGQRSGRFDSRSFFGRQTNRGRVPCVYAAAAGDQVFNLPNADSRATLISVSDGSVPVWFSRPSRSRSCAACCAVTARARKSASSELIRSATGAA